MSYTTVNQVPACGTTVNGLIVFPDSYTWPAIVNALTTLDEESEWGVNQLTEAQWSLLEQQGAVFLPAAGDRWGTSVREAGSSGKYWSSTYYATIYGLRTVYHLLFYNDVVIPGLTEMPIIGQSVRLVSDVTTSGNFNNQPFGVTPNP